MPTGKRGVGTVIEASAIARGKVVTLLPDGSVGVDLDAGDRITCNLLATGQGPQLQLERGDVVLVWMADISGEHGTILGRVRTEPGTQGREGTPDELVIEAKKGLVLRVGEGSITIRSDGKILIKGKDLVSHAKRMNRIRGGSVALN